MYAISDYALTFSTDYKQLRLVRNANPSEFKVFELTTNNPPYAVCIVNGCYEISQTTCSGCEDICVIDVEGGGGSATIDNGRLGLNIVDLRDTGRVKHVTFNLSCGLVVILRTLGPWGLHFKTADRTCFTVS